MCLCAVVSSGARFLTLSPPYSAHYREPPLPKRRITSCREGPQLWPSSWSWWWIDYTIILALGNSLIQTWTSWAKSYSSASDHQPLLIPDAGHPALSVTTGWGPPQWTPPLTFIDVLAISPWKGTDVCSLSTALSWFCVTGPSFSAPP